MPRFPANDHRNNVHTINTMISRIMAICVTINILIMIIIIMISIIINPLQLAPTSCPPPRLTMPRGPQVYSRRQARVIHTYTYTYTHTYTCTCTCTYTYIHIHVHIHIHTHRLCSGLLYSRGRSVNQSH